MEEKRTKQAKFYRKVLIALVIFFFIYYFVPMSIGVRLNSDYDLYIVAIESDFVNGEQTLKTTEYKNFTTWQKENVIATVLKHKKMRRLGTEISSARLNDFSKVYTIYVTSPDESEAAKCIIISENGSLVENEKKYRLLGTRKLITELEYILMEVTPE